MNYTKEQIKELITQILEDIDLEYFRDKDFYIKKGEPDFMDKKYNILDPWTCVVEGPDWQFDTDDGGYIFSIDDNEPHTIFFQDASGGQVPNAFIKKDENGKYYRDYIARQYKINGIGIQNHSFLFNKNIEISDINLEFLWEKRTKILLDVPDPFDEKWRDERIKFRAFLKTELIAKVVTY